MKTPLRRLITLASGLLITLGACAIESPSPEDTDLQRAAPTPALPALFENSLANESLTADTLALIRQQHLPEGCQAIEEVFVDLFEAPSGEPGSMRWSEIWIVTGCGTRRSYGVSFAEDGEGGAFFSLNPRPVTSDRD